MKNSYLTAGTRLSRFLKLIARNKFSVHPKYLFRVLFLLQNGLWASIFDKVEKIRYKKIIENYKMPQDPIFIIGHWRTGSTFLLQLMNINSELITPSLFHITAPDSLLISRKYYKPIMTRMVEPTRPMDDVKLGFDEPQEDEYALLKITNCSPLEKLIIPASKQYFLADYNDFDPEIQQANQWKKALHKFCKKLAFVSNKRVILKNPFHSMRIKTLLEMYPNAKFIHIYRHPYKVIPSTIRMWDIVGSQNCLNNKWQKPTINESITLFDKMLNYINNNLKNLPEEQYTEVRFEEFEQNPIDTLKAIYNKFDIPFSDTDKQKTELFLSQLKDYKKNSYNLLDEEKQAIDKQLAYYMKHYNYI